MDAIISELKSRYETVMRSGSDSLFYQNVHTYIDHIAKTPKLSAIIDKSESEYSKEHSDLWRPYTNDEKELDRREEETYRMERFSLFASHFCTLLVRIYWPIEYYKNTDDKLNGRIDPVAMLMLRGFDRTVKMRMWSKEDLMLHNKWFDGQRKNYENDMRQFQADFLTEIYKDPIQKKDIPVSESTEGVSFDPDSSILSIGSYEVEIKLKNDNPNSYYVLELMFKDEVKLQDRFYYSEMKGELLDTPLGDKDWRAIYRACKDIQEKVRKATKIEDFLIIKTGESGYIQVNSDYL